MHNIVIYTPERFAEVEAVAKQLHDESEFRGNSWNPEKLRATIESPGALCLIAEHEGECIGAFLGIITTQYFGDDLIASDLALFILPEYRGRARETVILMVEAYEQWARAWGAKEVWLSQSTGIMIDATRRLYEKLGYRVVGFNSKKEL